MDDIRGKLLAFMAEEFGLDTDEITDDSPLFSSGVLDSLALIDLVSFLEQQFGVKVSPLDLGLETLDTLERIVAFIETARA